MKSFILSISLALSLFASQCAMVPQPAFADIENAPFMPETDRRFNAIEQGNHLNYSCFPSGSCDGHWVRQTAQATYNYAVEGATAGATGTYTLPGPVSIPAGAIIQRSWVYSITQPTTSASGTLAFKCQNTSDILAATAAASFASAGASIDGASNTGGASTFKYITTACNIQAVVATGALTAGKVTAYVEYLVHQ